MQRKYLYGARSGEKNKITRAKVANRKLKNTSGEKNGTTGLSNLKEFKI